MRSAFHRCPDDADGNQAMTDGGESEEFPFRMFLQMVGGVTLALLGVTVGSAVITSGASPLVGAVGFGLMGTLMMAGLWLVGTAGQGENE